MNNPPNPYNLKINLNHQTAQGTPVKPLAHLIASTHCYCPHGGGHTVPEDEFAAIHRYTPSGTEAVYTGCFACLKRMQEATQTVPNDATKALLQRCREHIMDSDWKRVDALVADIDAMLKGQ